MKAQDSQKVAAHWSQYAAPPKQWLHNIYVREQVLLHPLGWTKGACWCNWLQRKYFEKPVDKALSLCCGSGGIERRMAQVHIANSIAGMDISPGQLERARAEAEKAGFSDTIKYIQSDIQNQELPSQEYDFVIVVAGLHHLENLPHVFQQMHRTLKKSGLLLITEYVGPDFMDYPQVERDLYNSVVKMIPVEKRIRNSTGKLLARAGQLTREQIIATDPSEGVNASQILPNLRNYFDTEVEVEMGSSMLRECLYDIVDNFSDSEEDTAYLQNMIDLERTLRKQSLIQNHHIFGVYRPKAHPFAN